RSTGGVTLHRTTHCAESGAARGTTHTGLLLGRRCRQLLLRKRNRIDASILGRPLVALELVALLLLRRLSLGGIAHGFRARRGHGERQAGDRCCDDGSVHRVPPPFEIWVAPNTVSRTSPAHRANALACAACALGRSASLEFHTLLRLAIGLLLFLRDSGGN